MSCHVLVIIDPFSRVCGVVTSTHSMVGLIMGVGTVTFDLYSRWDLLIMHCLVCWS